MYMCILMHTSEYNPLTIPVWLWCSVGPKRSCQFSESTLLPEASTKLCVHAYMSIESVYTDQKNFDLLPHTHACTCTCTCTCIYMYMMQSYSSNVHVPSL